MQMLVKLKLIISHVTIIYIIIYHLNSADELFLLHVNVRNIQPDIAKFCRCFAHLSKYISSLVNATLMREYRANTICSPDVFRIVSQNLANYINHNNKLDQLNDITLPACTWLMLDPDVAFPFPYLFHSDATFAAKYFPTLLKNKHRCLLSDFSEFSRIFSDQDPIPFWRDANYPAVTMRPDVRY